MDEYGCMKNNETDWDTIFNHLRIYEQVSFSYSADHYTAFVITIAGPLSQIGTMAFGGQIQGMFLISILHRGADYFQFKSMKELHPHYIEEKLGITNESDAIVIAQLLNEIRNRFLNND